MTPSPRQFLPLKPLDLLVLLGLAQGDRHGYALVQDIAQRTDGVVELEPGNFYRVIKRLLDLGLVAESDRRPAPELDDERRRYYRLTSLGSRVAAAELRRLSEMTTSADARRLVRRWEAS